MIVTLKMRVSQNGLKVNVNKHLLLIHIMTLSLLLGGDIVQIKLTNGLVFEEGEFIGTYMDHVHILRGEKLYYYPCDDIRSITSALGETFNYDCSDNTVTADILFPPELDPMTGEWVSSLPDVFNPEISKPVERIKTDSHKSRLENMVSVLIK